MLFQDPTSTPRVIQPTVRPAVAPASRLLQALVRGWRRHRALMEWNRNLPRPPGCAHLPDRVWRQRSALLSLRAYGTVR